MYERARAQDKAQPFQSPPDYVWLIVDNHLWKRILTDYGLSSIDLDALAVLIECIIVTPPLTELQRLQLADGENAGDLFGSVLQTHLASIENDFGALIEAASKDFAGYLSRGGLPSPYSALRIFELLREDDRKDVEEAFLTYWLKHVDGRIFGTTYVRLKSRLMSLNAEKISFDSVA